MASLATTALNEESWRLLDDFALAAMQQLAMTCAPNTIGDPKNFEQWCDGVAKCSYFMASCMMEQRNKTHEIILDAIEGKEAE